MGNIWVTGANGQLGNELRKLAGEDAHWHFTDLPELDICDTEACRAYLDQYHIRTIIHGAAYTAVDRAESDPETVFRINTQATLQLARLAATAGATLVFVSSDYVFDGANDRPYLESDPCRPLSVYGKSKYEAEKGIRESGVSGIILRTAWLYSAYGNNFVKTMLRLSAERESLQVVNDQIGTPTWAADLAGAIRQLLPQLESGRFHGEIFHYTNEGSCSWYDLAAKTIALAGGSCQVQPIPTSAYPTAARRPAYSVLSKAKIRQTFGIEPPHWEASLTHFLKEFL